jgi:hypothetical protein
MPEGPRQHHIVPAFYLAGFTDTGEVDGQLHAFDYLRTKHYRATARQVCRERDYFRLYEPDHDQNVVEHQLAEVENRIAPDVRAVRVSQRISNVDELASLICLATLIAARDRRNRQQLSEGLAASLKVHLAEGKIEREKWDRIRESEIPAGRDLSDLPEYDEARELMRAGLWAPRAPRVLEVGMIAEVQHALLGAMGEREWELMVTDPDETGGFITSDSPFVWGSLEDIRNGRLTAPLNAPNLELTFPVSKALALVGRPGARKASLHATREIVGHINMRTLQLSTGLVFHTKAEFSLRRQNGELRQSSEYFAYVKRARQDGMIRP